MGDLSVPGMEETMRYYKMIIGTNSEELQSSAERIKEKSNIRIGSSGYYSTPMEAVNDYLYRNTENHVTSVVYKEEDGCFHSVFSYDEQKNGFQAAYDSLARMLKDTFFIKRMIGEPVEITMIEFVDRLLEAKRKGYSCFSVNIADASHCWYYYVSMAKDSENLYYEYEEKMITDYESMKYAIYDREFRKELKNIETHKSHPDFKGNTVHYIISGRSKEAASDMTGALMRSLLKSHRISTGRMEIISEIEPGFSYYLLPEIKKYAIPVMLREGKAGKKAAINYMKGLIASSEYAQYADQAEEFMQLFPGNEFTQTDVLMAYEQFEPWCLNKNVLKAYDYDFSEGFMLDRDEEETSPYEKLHGLIGLDIVKKKIDSVLASDVIEKERKKKKGKRLSGRLDAHDLWRKSG